MTVYNVDQEIPEAAREELLADGRISDITYIELNGRDDAGG